MPDVLFPPLSIPRNFEKFKMAAATVAGYGYFLTTSLRKIILVSKPRFTGMRNPMKPKIIQYYHFLGVVCRKIYINLRQIYIFQPKCNIFAEMVDD